MSKKNEKKHKTIRCIRFIFIATFMISVIYIYKWNRNNLHTKEIQKKVETEIQISEQEIKIEDEVNVKLINADINRLKSINSDVIGWIKVEGTNINYPVVQGRDNSYYLNHSFDKTINNAGWIFEDYTNTNLENSKLDKNTVLYGHNRNNKDMFGTLPETLTEKWRSNIKNKYINFLLEDKQMVWEVFSTYKTESEDYYIKTQFNSDKEYSEFIKIIKNRSIYNYKTEVNTSDNILTLSTCTNISNGRVVVHAKRVY